MTVSPEVFFIISTDARQALTQNALSYKVLHS